MPYKTKDGETLSLAEVKSRFNLSSAHTDETAAIDQDVLDALELAFVVPDPAPAESLDGIKERKRRELNTEWTAADLSFFEFQGKKIAMDEASTRRMDGISISVTLTNSVPTTFTKEWKTMDNSMLSLADPDTFRAMYAAMVKARSDNFIKAQALKEAVVAAATPEAVAAISWNMATAPSPSGT